MGEPGSAQPAEMVGGQIGRARAVHSARKSGWRTELRHQLAQNLEFSSGGCETERTTYASLGPRQSRRLFRAGTVVVLVLEDCFARAGMPAPQQAALHDQKFFGAQLFDRIAELRGLLKLEAFGGFSHVAL